ncbi:MAG: sialate O-acetylesterase [Robiginitomaculum sp.]
MKRLALLPLITLLALGGCDKANIDVAPVGEAVKTAAEIAPIKSRIAGDLAIAAVFSDHMVIQRGEPIKVWGRAPEGADITVTFDGVEQNAQASEAGTWSTVFDARAEGGPYALEVAAGSNSLSFSDILIGDVFLCSGQSNMEMKVKSVFKAQSEIGRKHNPTIRQFHPRYKISPTPLAEFHEPQDWVVASSDTVGEFSAACYFFVKELQKTNPIPIGMMHSSWGGAQIQAWMREEDLRPFDGMEDSLDILAIYAKDKPAGKAALGAQWENWYQGESGEAPWTIAGAKLTGFKPLPGFKSWKQYGDKALENYDGLVWYKNTFTLTEEQAKKPVEISVGKLSKGDIAWINGQFLGRSVGWAPHSYSASPAQLRAGENHVLINVRSMWGDAGMLGPVDKVGFTPDGEDLTVLQFGWEYKKEPSDLVMAPLIPWQTMTGYIGMHNAMIEPLDGLRFKGAVWYQGESNSRRDAEYDEMLAAMVANWRRMFGEDMPVVIVQLPDFGDIPTEPGENTWSNFREAQRLAALRDEGMGLAVTLGLGNATDIHPLNKQDVGKRIAMVYRGLIGETDFTRNGYSPKRVYARGDTVRVQLPSIEGGYVTRSDNHPINFQLCVSDHPAAAYTQGGPLNCAYATASMEGDSVVLTSKIGQPSHVRYCWGMAPSCNLYAAEGTPVGPFQMEIER